MASINFVNLAAELGIIGTLQGDELRARCPFHDDHTPSWSMNVNTGLWICHRGCGRGEMTDLVIALRGVTYSDAAAWVREHNHRVAVEQISAQLAQEMLPSKPAASGRAWLEHYERLGASVMPLWFLKRGFSWRTIQHWGIRYDPVDAVVIPVWFEGELVGTITRQARAEPKYVNSVGLERSKLLFGENYPAHNLIIIVEGVLDAIWCWQAGLSAFALLGTQLSSLQIGILRKHRFGEVVLALDNDEAGREASGHILKQLMPYWLLPQISVMIWPSGAKDAQDCTTEQLLQVFQERTDAAWNPLHLGR